MRFDIFRKNGERYECFIDEADADLLEAGPWFVQPKNRGGWSSGPYVIRCIPHPTGGKKPDGRKRDTTQAMHRIIVARLGVKKFSQVDHLNGNGLDNRRQNLRPATPLVNSQNRGMNKNNSSGHKGLNRVVLAEGLVRWEVQMMVNWKLVYLGSCDSFEEAVELWHRERVRLSPSDPIRDCGCS